MSDAVPVMMLLSGVMRGALTRAGDGKATTNAAAAAAAAAAAPDGRMTALDEWRFAAAVQPQTLRLVHDPRRGRPAAAAAAQLPDQTPPLFGTCAPTSLLIEVWALDANSEEAARLDRDESAAAAAGFPPPPLPAPLPWAGVVAQPGWRRLLGPALSVQFRGEASSSDGDAADRNVVLALSVPQPQRGQPFSTRRVLVRGSYSHVSVMLYGTCSAASGVAQSVARGDARGMVEQMQRRALSATVSPKDGPPPRHAHACFRPLLPLYPAPVLRTLVFDHTTAAATVRTLSKLLTEAPAAREQARQSLAALVAELRQLHLLPEAEKARESAKTFVLDSTALERLGTLVTQVLHGLDSLDDATRTAFLSSLGDGTVPSPHDMRQTTRALSMLLCCTAPGASMALPQCQEKSFTTMRRFVRAVSARLVMPLAIARHVATLLARLVQADPMLAESFTREGWLWLLGWLAAPTPPHAQGSASASSAAAASAATAVGADPTQRGIALYVLNALLVHPKSLDVLSKQSLLPGAPKSSTASSSSSSTAAAAAVVSFLPCLHSYGTIAAGCIGLGAMEQHERAPVRAAHRAVRSVLRLHGLFRAAQAAFAEFRAAMASAAATPADVDAEQLHATQNKLVVHLRALTDFLSAASGRGGGAPAELSLALLHHAAHYQLPAMLQELLFASLGTAGGGGTGGRAASAAAASASAAAAGAAASPLTPLELFDQLLSPLLMRVYFGSHSSLQSVLSFAEGEGSSHNLFAALHALAARLRPAAGSTSAVAPLDGGLLPWQRVRRLSEWCEARVQALQLLLHACALPSPSRGQALAQTPRLREQAWNFLASFLEGHPFGTDAVAWVLGRSRRFVASMPAPAGSGSAAHPPAPAPLLPLVALHQFLRGVFLEQGPYAALAQRHAIAAFNALASSIHAPSLFFSVRGHVPLVSRGGCEALVRSLAPPAAATAGAAGMAWCSVGSTSGVSEHALARFVSSVSAVELVQRFRAGGGDTDDAGWDALFRALGEKLGRSGLLSLALGSGGSGGGGGSGGPNETLQLVRLLQCTHMLLEGDESAHYLPPSEGQGQQVPALNAPLHLGALARSRARATEMANQRRVVEMLFRTEQASGWAGTGAAGAGDASAVSPRVLRLLHLFCSAFSDEGAGPSGGGSSAASAMSDVASSAGAGSGGASVLAQLTPQGMALMQVAAEGLDATLALLRSAMEFLCTLPWPPSPAAGGGGGGAGDADAAADLDRLEEGEVSPDCLAHNRVAHALARVRLGGLHDTLWRVHELLAGHDLFFHHFVALPSPPEECEDECGATPPPTRSGSLGHFPRIRRNLHACLRHTLWHLVLPAGPGLGLAQPPPDVALAHPGEEGLPPLSWPPRLTGAEKWWCEELFPVGKVSAWVPSVCFLLDVLPQPLRRGSSGGAGVGEGEAVPRLGAWASFERQHLWAPLLAQLEFGPALPPGCPPLLRAPELLSATLLSDALLSTSSLAVQSILRGVVSSLVDSAPVPVARALLDRFVNQTGLRSKQVRDALEAAMRARTYESVSPPHGSNLLISAASLCATAQMTHAPFYLHMQMLQELLHHDRARLVLNAMEICSWIKPLLQMTVPPTAAAASASGSPGSTATARAVSSPLAVASEHDPNVQEALGFQLIALECARLSLDSSALVAAIAPDLEAEAEAEAEADAEPDQPGPGLGALVDGDVDWGLMRPLWGDLVPMVLSPHPALALAAGRVLLAAAQGGRGCRELLGWMANPTHVRTVCERACIPLPGSASAAGAGTGAAAGTASGAIKPTGHGSPLLLWLSTRIDQWEASDAQGGSSISALELEMWGQIVALLRCFITFGAVHHHSQPQPQPQPHQPSVHASASGPGAGASSSKASAPPVPPGHVAPTDRWWAETLSQVFPGLRSLCAALGWPSRKAAHAPSDTNMLHRAAAGSLPFLPIQPDHPLVRIASRLAALKAAKAPAAPPSASAMQLSSLLNALHTLIHRCQLGGVLVLHEVAPTPSHSRAAGGWTIEAKYDALARAERRPLAEASSAATAHASTPEGTSRFDFLFPTSLSFLPAPPQLATTPIAPLPDGIASLSLRSVP